MDSKLLDMKNDWNIRTCKLSLTLGYQFYHSMPNNLVHNFDETEKKGTRKQRIDKNE